MVDGSAEVEVLKKSLEETNASQSKLKEDLAAAAEQKVVETRLLFGIGV